MKKNILFSSHDPGGANILLSVIKEIAKDLDNYNIYLLLLGKAKEKIQLNNKNIFPIEVNSTKIEYFTNEYKVYEEDISNIFQRYTFDMVFTATSGNSNLEKLVIKYAKINNITSLSIIDFWSNYLKRFTINNELFFPDYIFVIDKKMFSEVKDLVNKNTKLIISGNPYLNELINNYQNIKTKYNSNVSKNKIRFFSENISLYYPEREINEYQIVKDIINNLIIEFPVEFIIRPHPLESKQKWLEFVGNFNHIKNLNLKIDDLNSFADVLKENFISLGISSMALIETSITGKNTYSYQINLKKEDYLAIPFYEYGINEIKNQKDINMIFNNETRYSNATHENSIEIIKEIINNV